MAACLTVTAPLELVLGARVYRSPRRLAAALTVPVLLFSAWDVLAVHRRHWWFSSRYTTGWHLPGHLPVEELVFFVAVPLCTLLTYEAVRRVLGDA